MFLSLKEIRGSQYPNEGILTDRCRCGVAKFTGLREEELVNMTLG